MSEKLILLELILGISLIDLSKFFTESVFTL